jgi:hypothetical protein
MPRIPDIPGDLIEGFEHVGFLKEQVARLCGLDRYRFVNCALVPATSYNDFGGLSHVLFRCSVRMLLVSSVFLVVNQSALEERI